VRDTQSRLHHLVPLLAVQAVGFACGIVGVRWSSSVIPPAILGVYGLLISTPTFAAFVTHQGMVQHAQRYWTTSTSGRLYLRLLLGAMARPTSWLAAGLAGVLLLFTFTAGVAVGWGWWGWMLAVNLLTLGAHLAHAALQAEQRYWAHFAVAAIGSATRSFLPLLLVLVGSATLATLGAGFLLHTALWLAAGALCLRGAWQRDAALPAEPLEPPQRMIGAFFGAGLCGWIAGNAPRWFAALALTPETTGYFMLAANLSAVVPAAISLVGVGYTFPPLFAASRAGASDAHLLRLTNRNVAIALVAGQVALLALAWCGPHLIGLVVHARYAQSMGWLLAAGGGALAMVSASFYGNLLVARNRTAACFRLFLISAAFRVAILAGLALAPGEQVFRLGLTLLAWPTAALEWWLMRRWVGGRPSTGSGSPHPAGTPRPAR
jgi:hypothetical protein